MKKHLVAVLSILFLFSLSTHSTVSALQTFIAPQKIGSSTSVELVQVNGSSTAQVITSAPPQATASAANAAAATPATKSLEDTKVALLLKEKFDRTTPSVLKTWNSPKPGSEKPKDPAAKQTSAATVKVAFEDFMVLLLEKEDTFKANDVLQVELDGEAAGQFKVLSVDKLKISAQRVVEAKAAPAAVPKPANATKPADAAETPKKAAAETAKKNEAAADDGKSETEQKEQKPDAADTAAPKTEPLSVGAKVQLSQAAADTKSQADVDAQAKIEVAQFVSDVLLGDWEQVKIELGKYKKAQAEQLYAHLLRSLATAPRKPGAQRGQKQPTPHLTPTDILMLTEAAPNPIRVKTEKPAADDKTPAAKSAAVPVAGNSNPFQTANLPPGAAQALAQAMANKQLPPGVTISPNGDVVVAPASASGSSIASPAAAKGGSAHIAGIAMLIRNAKRAGHNFGDFHKSIQQGTTHFGGDDPIKRLTAASLFMQAGMTKYVEEFLPELDDADTKSNLPALKIWSQFALAMHNEKQITEWLDKAWMINQSIVAVEDVEVADRNAALANLVRLSSKVDKAIGTQWVNESFKDSPELGMAILTNLGTSSADMATKAAQISENTRMDLLRLQNEAVEKLIKLAPESAKAWKQTLDLLIQNWLIEAKISLENSEGSVGRDFMEVDMYGNYYWTNSQQRAQRYGNNNRQPRPIKLHEILEIAPSEAWQSLADTSMHMNLQQSIARLHLRTNEENKAFPYIEKMADSQPEAARELVHNFLQIWAQNHDPNSSNRRRNPYIYSYGFDRKAQAIPLTRSKQERNLEELADWVTRIRKLPIEDVEERLLANAFTACHSSAEVFKLDRFREVFGDFGKLKPETIAEICEKMRTNLASNWRKIKNQEQKQTNRKEPEVQQEVIGGYETALRLASEALESSPDDWKLHLTLAKLMFDQNDYTNRVQKSSEFSNRRDVAFAQFKLAAEKYADVSATLSKMDQSTDVYDNWFYAALGAADLGRVTDKTVADLKQYPQIREAIEGLTTELAEIHMARFANNLFARMSPIKPEIKFRYLRAGFEIAGDHPRAYEAKQLYDYYKDLVHEIKLSVEIDGDDKPGHGQPFGCYVNILHTREIERESGGFGKYVQNQNAMSYSYNYGRPTENYRDKFNDVVELALGEHFEVINVTFQSSDGMKSRPAAQAGWRTTPYAYVLLKAKGPEVDRIAPLKLDFDFLDTSGYVVVPVESPALIVDCSASKPAMRPVADLKLIQTLDERQADEGKLIVEISATAKGLVPNLNDIIKVDRENFEVVSVDDQGVLPSSFEKESNEVQISSLRSWTVEYAAKEDTNEQMQFSFSEPVIETATSKFQRYVDADLVEVDQLVSLEKSYENLGWNFLYWLIPLVALGLAGIAALIFASSGGQTTASQARFEMPDDVNPFTVLTLLKDIRNRNGISTEQGNQLQHSIERIEQYYFGEEADEQPEDLETVARQWLRNAK